MFEGAAVDRVNLVISTWELLDQAGLCTPDFFILLVASCLRCMVRVTMQL